MWSEGMKIYMINNLPTPQTLTPIPIFANSLITNKTSIIDKGQINSPSLSLTYPMLKLNQTFSKYTSKNTHTNIFTPPIKTSYFTIF